MKHEDLENKVAEDTVVLGDEYREKVTREARARHGKAAERVEPEEPAAPPPRVWLS